MRTGNLFFSLVHLFVAFFLAAAGALSIALHYSLATRQRLALFLEADSHLFFLFFGSGIVIFSLFLLIGLYTLNKTKYLQLQMNDHQLSIDQSIVRSYVVAYWKQRFPNFNPSVDISLRPNQKLEIITDPPPIPAEEKQHFFENVESDLSQILREKMGYDRPFVLTVITSS